MPKTQTSSYTQIHTYHPPHPIWVGNLAPSRALTIPFAFALALAVLGFSPSIRLHANLFLSFECAAAMLTAGALGLLSSASRNKKHFQLSVVLQKQHYLQACAQGSVFLYWGWYWQPVFDSVLLIFGQVLFAYACDMLIIWSRRTTYNFGFSPFPVVFSINLFLWFKPDWFYMQFLMVALGFAAKEFVQWNKGGRRTHIFNPSSFPLALVSLALIASGNSDTTMGMDIAVTQFYPRHIYLFIFLIGIPGQFFFGVTTMTASAVLATYLFGLAYFSATGVYYFFDSYIPVAVFLGMHLLFTDPSTSPRTDFGRIIFGCLYGLSTVLLYYILGNLGLPTFYDKLLQVPLLNLSVKAIDSWSESKLMRWFNPKASGQSLAPRYRNLAPITIWAIIFAVMITINGVGDHHPGQFLPFWQKACTENRSNSCQNLEDMYATFCSRDSGWACNQFGILLSRHEPYFARTAFEIGCGLGSVASCNNAKRADAGTNAFESTDPFFSDYPIILRGTKGPIQNETASNIFARACEQNWPNTCGISEIP